MDGSEINEYLFDPHGYIASTKWLVRDLIPLNSLTLLLSQSGVGKSFVVEWLAICIQYGIDFLGYKTINGDVLYIDQDTPTDTLRIRLKKFIGGRHTDKNFYLHSNKDYEISEELLELVNQYNVKLIVIDCLTRLIGHTDINDPKGMAKLSLFKNKVLEDMSKDVSLVIVHHTSDKKIFTLDEVMESQNHGLFTFGSSIINQVADTILLLYSPDRGKKVLKQLYLRPIAKRFQIDTTPLKLKFVDRGNEMYLVNEGYYSKEGLLEKRILETLTKSEKVLWKPKEIYDNIGLYSETVVREKLREMIALKKISYSVTKHNLHLISALNANKRKEYKVQLKEMLNNAGVKNVSMSK